MIKGNDKVAIIAGDRVVSFNDLLDYINIYAQHTPQTVGGKTVIFSENRIGWLFAFYSVWQNKGIAVPIDASSKVDDVAYILRDCQPSCIWTSKERLHIAEEAVAETGLNVKILLIDDYEKADCAPRGKNTWLEEDGIFSYENKTPALIIYTSGTTGSPKGVVLSYANLHANLYSVSEEVPIFDGKRRTLILLPLHHILPLMGTAIAPIVSGGGVAIAMSMSGPDIMDALGRGEVGIFIGVPRLWQTLYSGIKKKIDSSFVTRMLFSLCERVGSQALSRFVFSAVHKKLGGHLEYCVSGGAALDTEIGRGLKTLGISMLEGYGMTETAPIISFTRPGDIIPGCVGLPLTTVETRIIEGEICVKGPNVMLGYYNRPEETAQVIDKDGFVHTGDLGYLDELGRIHITGRSKEIIVLSNGKNIQPSEIEYKLEKYDDKIKEVAVTQDGDMLCAIIVPQETWAASLSDEQIEEELKRQIMEPYNKSVVNYKKIMKIHVYHGELPRTRMEKLQRFKLKEILGARGQEGSRGFKGAVPVTRDEQMSEEYRILKTYIEEEKKVSVTPDSHIETDLAFDSLDNVGLQGFIEQTFGIEIKADTFASFANIGAIAEHIANNKTRTEVENIDWHTIFTTDASHLKLPQTSGMFTTYAAMFRKFLKRHNSLEVRGTENIPQTGNFIVAPNHQCYLDGAICVMGLEDNTLCNSYFFAKEQHVNNFLLRYMARNNNIILMEMNDLKNSILKLSEVLKQGKNIVIFPEGTRSVDGKIGTFKKTFAILAKELNVPILPVRITGAYEAMPRGKKWPNKNKITVEYLPVITPTAESTYEALTEATREAIS